MRRNPTKHILGIKLVVSNTKRLNLDVRILYFLRTAYVIQDSSIKIFQCVVRRGGNGGALPGDGVRGIVGVCGEARDLGGNGGGTSALVLDVRCFVGIGGGKHVSLGGCTGLSGGGRFFCFFNRAEIKTVTRC